MRDTSKIDFFFFGRRDEPGHGCHCPKTGNFSYYHRPDPFGSNLDSGYAPKDSAVQFRCSLVQKDGWTLIAFWDNTIDKRGKSNAAFVAKGLLSFDEILEKAETSCPRLFEKRFKEKLTLAHIVKP